MVEYRYECARCDEDFGTGQEARDEAIEHGARLPHHIGRLFAVRMKD